MSSISKRFAAVVVSLVLTSGSLYARPAQDPGTDGGSSIGSRIVKLVRAVRNLVKVGFDDLSIPHP